MNSGDCKARKRAGGLRLTETLPDLAASIRVLEKAGFVPAHQSPESGVIRFRHRRS